MYWRNIQVLSELVPDSAGHIVTIWVCFWMGNFCSVGLKLQQHENPVEGLLKYQFLGSNHRISDSVGRDEVPKLDFLHIPRRRCCWETETPVLGAIWVTLRDTADVRISYLSYLSMANERMKVICLEM